MLHVILADLEEEKAIRLQMRILDREHDAWEQINLDVITDEAYYQEYFSVKKTADLLIIAEYMYSDLVDSNFEGEIIILSEAVRPDRTINEHCTVICKNGNLDYMLRKLEELKTVQKSVFAKEAECKVSFTELLGNSNEYTAIPNNQSITQQEINESVEITSDEIPVKQKKTRLLTVSAATGGVGKTVVSLGIASALSEKERKVLYLNVDECNNFQWRLDSMTTVSHNYPEILNTAIPDWERIKTLISGEKFNYLLPFSVPLYMLNLECSLFEKVLYAAINSHEYDLIIADLGNVERRLQRRFINSADFVLLISRQDKGSVYALQSMAERLEISNDSKYFTVCNAFRADAYNGYQSGEIKVPFVLDAYLGFEEKVSSCSIEELGKLPDLLQILEIMKL